MRHKLRWLGALAAIVVLPAAALAIAASVIDPNDYKPRLIDAVHDATGRVLTLDGPLRVAWSLWPTLQVNQASLSNADGGTRPDMARVERIEAQISLPALLDHRLDIIQLTLIGPNVLFETAQGKPNWVFDQPASAAPATAPTSAPFRLEVRNVHVQNGMMTSRLPGSTRVIGLRSFDLHHRPDDGPLDFAGTLVYGDNQPFALRVAADPAGGLHDPWRTTIDFAAYDTTAHADGTMTLAGDYDLTVAAQSGALEKLNALLPQLDLPAMHQADLSAHVVNNPVLGGLPTIGPARLRFASLDLRAVAPGLSLGRTELALPAAGGDAAVTAQGSYGGQPFTLTGAVEVPRRPEARGDLRIDLKATAAAASASLAGKLAVNALRFAGLEASAALAAPALAPLRTMLTQSLPALTDIRFSAQLSVPADLGSARFSNMKLASQAGDLGGSVSIGSAPVLQAKLHSTRLDLDTLLQAFGLDQAAAAPTSGRVFGDTRLPWLAADGPVADISATIATALFEHETWRDAVVSVKLDGGRRAVTVKLAMPAGPLEISATADASAATVPASFTVRAPGVPLALLAHYAGLPGAVTGAAKIDAQLHGGGHTVHELAGSLDGSFSLTAVGGTLSNAAFATLTAGSLDALGTTIPKQGETDLRCLGLVGTASDGVLRLRTIVLETTYLSLDGAGQVDLGKETLALKLHPLAQVAGSPVAVPVVVEGPFRDIKGRLDASGLDKVGLLIDGLFGGDKPESCMEAGLLPASK